MAGLPVLTYFDGRGNAQRVRYALVGAGLKWTERYLKVAGDMDKVRPDCLFGQVRQLTGAARRCRCGNGLLQLAC